MALWLHVSNRGRSSKNSIFCVKHCCRGYITRLTYGGIYDTIIPFIRKVGGWFVSQIEKLLKKFREKPVCNDMTYDEIKRIASYYGCIVTAGGKHPIIICDKESGMIITVPGHGKCVKEAYISQLRELFDEIEARAK